jgi:CheY-like chemotaxis protein
MEPLRVLVVEDEPFISLELEDIVRDAVPSLVVVKSTVKEAKKVLNETFNLALLDVSVTNGETHEIARLLDNAHVPYAFVSATEKKDLPPELQRARFIPKPFRESQVTVIVLDAEKARRAV